MSLYKPVPGTRYSVLMVCLEKGHMLAGMIPTDVQRDACRRLLRRMHRMNLVKIEVRRWLTVKG